MDYDETEEADQQTMSWVDQKLNATVSQQERNFDYTTCVDRETNIRMKDGTTKEIQTIQLGESLSTGKVIGVVKKQVTEYCCLPSSECVTPGLCFWQRNQWVRAGDALPIEHLQHSQTFYSLIVSGTASFETEKGVRMRDYVEIHSPEAEQFYAKKIQSLPSCILAE